MELWVIETQLSGLNELTAVPLSDDQLRTDAQELAAILTDEGSFPTETDLVVWFAAKFQAAQPDLGFTAATSAVAIDLLAQHRHRPHSAYVWGFCVSPPSTPQKTTKNQMPFH